MYIEVVKNMACTSDSAKKFKIEIEISLHTYFGSLKSLLKFSKKSSPLCSFMKHSVKCCVIQNIGDIIHQGSEITTRMTLSREYQCNTILSNLPNTLPEKMKVFQSNKEKK